MKPGREQVYTNCPIQVSSELRSNSIDGCIPYGTGPGVGLVLGGEFSPVGGGVLPPVQICFHQIEVVIGMVESDHTPNSDWQPVAIELR